MSPVILIFQIFHRHFGFHIPRWFNILTCVQSTPLIVHSTLVYDSQWSIMLSMERSLCCTFPLCNSNMSYTKSHNNFTVFFQNPSIGSHCYHLVGCINIIWSMHSIASFLLIFLINFLRFPNSNIVCSPHWSQCESNQTWQSWNDNFFWLNASVLVSIRAAQ